MSTEDISQLQTCPGHESLPVDCRKKVERRVRSPDSLVGDVSVKRRGLKAAVTKQHLDRANVGTRFQQMSREAVSKGAQSDGLGQTGTSGGLLTDPLNNRQADVMSR